MSRGRRLAARARQDSLAGRGAVGTLRDPTAVGRPRAPTEPGDNDGGDPGDRARLACNCGCNLDVYTCRTTDFTCTYSPALHREVLALKRDGLTAQQVLDAFVAKYGEKALMAPKPKGFITWPATWCPVGLILAAGAGLVGVDFAPESGGGRRGGADGRADGAGAVKASAEEMERLRQALNEVED